MSLRERAVRFFAGAAVERVVEAELERREVSYTDAIIQAIVAQATGSPDAPRSVAPVEVAAGYWSRAFSSARILPETEVTRALTPLIMGMIGRALVVDGELCLLIEVDMRRGVLISPAAGWDVYGPYDRRNWRYRLTLQGPDKDSTRRRRFDGAEVIHAMYAVNYKNPFKGISPLTHAALTGTLQRNIEQRLKEEYSGPVGSIIPVPDTVENVTALATDVKGLKGRAALVETTAGGWGDGTAERPQSDFKPQRIGAAPPEATVSVRENIYDSIISACGVPPGLVHASTDGTAKREAWRQFLHGTIGPVARTLERELSEKLDLAVTIDFNDLHASDIQGRARAYKSLVDGGMPPADAAEICGFGRRGLSDEPREPMPPMGNREQVLSEIEELYEGLDIVS